MFNLFQNVGKCLSTLPNPPTGSPTRSGGLEVYYPDYSVRFPEGICINDAPLPNGRVIYPTKEQCCAGAYAGQSSLACSCDAKPRFGCPGVVAYTSQVVTSTMTLPRLTVPSNEADLQTLISVLKSTIEAILLVAIGSSKSVDVTILSIGGVNIRRGLRRLLARRVSDGLTFKFKVVYNHGYTASDVNFEGDADAITKQIKEATKTETFEDAITETLASLPDNPLKFTIEQDVVIVSVYFS